MTSASSGRVRTMLRTSGMIRLTKRATVPRTCGMAMVISPSAVSIGLVRLAARAAAGAPPLRQCRVDPALSGLDRLDAAAVARTGRRRRTLVARSTQERGPLVFKGALQDQSGSQTTKISDVLV